MTPAYMSPRLTARIGRRIECWSRAVLRRVYGLRIPAARVRLQDRIDDRECVLLKIAFARADLDYWSSQLEQCDADIAVAAEDLWDLAIKSNSRAGFRACDALGDDIGQWAPSVRHDQP